MILFHDKFALDVSWSLFDSRQEAERLSLKEAQTRAGKSLVRVCGRKVHDKKFVRGMVMVAESEKGMLDQPVHAAALVIADTYPTFVVFHQFADAHDTAWFCAASHGEPINGYDRIMTVRDAWQAFSDLAGSLDNPVILGNIPEATVDVEAFLIQKGEAKKGLPASAKLKTPAGRLVVPLMIAAGVLLLAGLGYGGYQLLSKPGGPDAEAIAQMQAALMLQEQQRLEAERQEAIAQVVALQREQVLNAVPLVQQWSDWLRFMSSVPMNVAGWSPKEILCIPTQCTVNWARGDGVFPSSADQLPGERSVTSSTDSAVTTFALDQIDAREYRVEDARDLLVFFQDLPIRKREFDFVFAPPISEVAAVIPPELQREGEATPLIGREGTFTITSNRLFMIREVLTRLEHAGVRLNSLQVGSFDGGRTPSQIVLEGAFRTVAETGEVAQPNIEGMQ